MRAWLVCLGLGVVLSSSVLADSASIHRMVVGDKALELQDTVKLTSAKDGEVESAWISPDGAYIVYSVAGEDGQSPPAKVCIISSLGGRSDVLVAAPKNLEKLADAASPFDAWVPDLDEQSPVVWSPDSKSIALAVAHFAFDPAHNMSVNDTCVMVMTTAGQRRALFTLPANCWMTSPIIWSADSRRLACAVESMRSDSNKKMTKNAELVVMDMQNGSVESIFAQTDTQVSLDRWRPDGKSVLHYDTGHGDKAYRQMESFLDGTTNSVGPDLAAIPNKSPDGRMQVAGSSGLSVEDTVTGDVKEVFKNYAAKAIGWTPDSKMIIYKDLQAVKDAPGNRKMDLDTVWIAVPEKQKMNHMCVALDGCVGTNDVFSRDGLRMTYTSEGRVFVASLGWTSATTYDMIAAGLLTEDAEKAILVKNAHLIGVGLQMYSDDYGGPLPSGEEFAQQLAPYLRQMKSYPTYGNPFNRPGTDQMAFQYYPLGDLNSVSSPADTKMGMFDVGYGWQIVLYADGHVKVVPKQ